jgi:hypothetical protein
MAGTIRIKAPTISNLRDPIDKDYVDTTTPAISYGGWGDGDVSHFSDLLSTYPRASLNNAINFASFAASNQYVYLMKVTRAFTSTGVRFVTGATSGTTGNTVTATLYTGTTQASMTLRHTATAPFTTTSTMVQVAWGASPVIAVGWIAIVFTCTAAGGTPPRIMTLGNNNAAGASFLNPAAGSYMVASRASTTLSNPMDFTTGWTTGALPPWIAMY